MPTMPATKAPQAAATMTSRRRALVCPVDIWSVDIIVSQRPDQHRRSLDQRHQVEQHDERAERQRDRDRAGAAAAFLLLRQHNAVVGRDHGASPKRASALSTSSAANSTNT